MSSLLEGHKAELKSCPLTLVRSRTHLPLTRGYPLVLVVHEWFVLNGEKTGGVDKSFALGTQVT